MNKVAKYLIYIVCIITIIQTSTAKKRSIFEGGVYGGISNITHKVDFYELPGFINYGPSYETTSNINMTMGLFGEYRINNLFSFQTRLGYLPLNTELKAREFIGNQEIDGELVHVYSNHSLIPNLSMLTISPLVIIKPISKFGLFFSVGTNFGIFLENNAVQYEKLDESIFNRGIEFSDGSNSRGQTRNQIENELLVNKSIYAIVFGVGYKYKLNDKFSISINGDYNYWLMNIFPQKEWKLTNSTVSLSISYSIIDEEIMEEEINDETPIEIQTHFEKKVIVDNEPEKQHIEPVKETTQDSIQSKDCYYIIFATSENAEEIKNLFESINGNGLDDIRISTYYDSNDKITYHRLCSKCFENSEEIISYYDELVKRELINKFSSYYIKHGDDEFEK